MDETKGHNERYPQELHGKLRQAFARPDERKPEDKRNTLHNTTQRFEHDIR